MESIETTVEELYKLDVEDWKKRVIKEAYYVFSTSEPTDNVIKSYLKMRADCYRYGEEMKFYKGEDGRLRLRIRKIKK